jgi:hypothetical protein
MKTLIASGVVCIGIGVAIGFGTASFGLVPHDHSSHNPVPIPDSWTDAEVAAFIAESDRKIDTWAGRVVAPGEVITHEGLEFKKSTPEMLARRDCVWCPVRLACHNTPSPSPPSAHSTASRKSALPHDAPVRPSRYYRPAHVPSPTTPRSTTTSNTPASPPRADPNIPIGPTTTGPNPNPLTYMGPPPGGPGSKGVPGAAHPGAPAH